MSLNSFTGQVPGTGPSTARWIGWTVTGLIMWGVVYSQLIPFSDWVVASTGVDPKSHLGEAASFFAYDTPKVLMLLTLVVFGMGVVRSFFSPEKTRALLSREARGHRQCAGGVARHRHAVLLLLRGAAVHRLRQRGGAAWRDLFVPDLGADGE